MRGGGETQGAGGESSHPIYRSWAAMRHRCGPNAGANEVDRYYRRGIRVCREWQDYDAFREWSLVNGWAPGLSLDRIDNNGDYNPENCRWATDVEQADNRGNTVWVKAWGERKTLAEWVHDPRCVVDYWCAYDRLIRAARNGTAKNWRPERALATPKRRTSLARPGAARYVPYLRGGVTKVPNDPT